MVSNEVPIGELENRLRSDSYSLNRPLLGEDELLLGLIHDDEETERKIGVSNVIFANRMEYFIKAAGDISEEGIVIDGKYKVGGFVYRGGPNCPWEDKSGEFDGNSALELNIENLSLGESLSFQGLMVHTIREHHFYGGKQSQSRIDPEYAARILDLI